MSKSASCGIETLGSLVHCIKSVTESILNLNITIYSPIRLKHISFCTVHSYFVK